ncbi:hypothetical protein [Geomicrobium sp. JCM 19055]|uniref:hypothetical protein n=1 Tax=Geomicrobium sp. JCM 19055 TaxID=1460649 RepID=UPI0005A665DD|nr:hypothetical protein [Geomicrobium sp. JCM 19055]
MFTTVQFWVVIWIGLDRKFRKLNIVTKSTDVRDVENLFYQRLEQEMYREIVEIVEITRRREIRIEEEQVNW